MVSTGGVTVVADNLEPADDLADSVEADALGAKDAEGDELGGRRGPEEAARGSNKLLDALEKSPRGLQLLEEGLVVALEGGIGSGDLEQATGQSTPLHDNNNNNDNNNSPFESSYIDSSGPGGTHGREIDWPLATSLVSSTPTLE